MTRYYLRIYLNSIADKMYLPYVHALCKTLFPNGRVSQYTRKSRGTDEIQISSSEVCQYLPDAGFDPKSRTIPHWIQSKREYSAATIRGLFDTEGSVSLKRFAGRNGSYVYAQLAFTNKNENLLNFAEKNLRKLGYKPTKGSAKNIYISNARDVDRYMIEIGSSNPKLAEKLKLRVAFRARRSGRVV